MHHDIQLFAEYAVTPFVGVWIETYGANDTLEKTKSHPSWVCGLKRNITSSILKGGLVTPFVGVWIETLNLTWSKGQNRVTPFVGVWIETRVTLTVNLAEPSHTLRGCVD